MVGLLMYLARAHGVLLVTPRCSAQVAELLEVTQRGMQTAVPRQRAFPKGPMERMPLRWRQLFGNSDQQWTWLGRSPPTTEEGIITACARKVTAFLRSASS